MEKRERRMLAAVQDIFFAAKISAASKRTGVPVEFVADEGKLLETAAAVPSMVIVDLNQATIRPIELVRKLKASPGAADIQVVGYLSHVQQDLLREAQKAGCDLVLPRSVFSQQVHELLRQRSCHI